MESNIGAEPNSKDDAKSLIAQGTSCSVIDYMYDLDSFRAIEMIPESTGFLKFFVPYSGI